MRNHESDQPKQPDSRKKRSTLSSIKKRLMTLKVFKALALAVSAGSLALAFGCKSAPSSPVGQANNADQLDVPQFISYAFESESDIELVTSTHVGPLERRDFPFVLLFTLPYSPGFKGLPTKEDYPNIAKLEKQLWQKLLKLNVIPIGHVIRNGELVSLACASKKIDSRITIEGTSIDYICREDPAWATYEQMLRPNSIEALAAEYQSLFDTLAKEGDVAEKPRDVDFPCVFQSKAERSAFLGDIASAGYRVNALHESEPDGEYWAELALKTAITPAVILPRVAYLRKAAERHNGEFDGWACGVMK